MSGAAVVPQTRTPVQSMLPEELVSHLEAGVVADALPGGGPAAGGVERRRQIPQHLHVRARQHPQVGDVLHSAAHECHDFKQGLCYNWPHTVCQYDHACCSCVACARPLIAAMREGAGDLSRPAAGTCRLDQASPRTTPAAINLRAGRLPWSCYKGTTRHMHNRQHTDRGHSLGTGCWHN